jgi:predicted RNase H-like HicB family nuclease
MRYLVRIFLYNGDYSAMVPDLPGCIAAGDTVEEVRNLITEAIELHVDLMRQSGETVSVPTKHLDLNVDALEAGELFTWVEVDIAQPVTSA